jgi:outer membrane protein OmpA-like peptidoglycan-associated protein
MMKKKYINRSVAIALTAPLILASCSSTSSLSNTTLGCLGGAAIGSVAVFIDSGDPGKAVLGGLIGGAIGCAVGNYLVQREEKLAKLAEKNSFKPEFERISVTEEAGTSFSKDAYEDVIASQISINSEQPLFASNQASVNDFAKLKNLRAFLKGYVETIATGSKIYVVGHTDSSGSAKYNQALSERRAKYIAQLLVEAGAERNAIYYEGVGESQPVARNQTEVDKAKNRRFELIDVIPKKNKEKGKQQLNKAAIENVIQVAAAKKKRIDNVINTLPQTKKYKSGKKEAKIAMIPQVKKSRVSRGSSLDLGGVPLSSFDEQYVTAALGDAPSDSSWSLFSQAHASTYSSFVGSCAYSDPVVQSKLKAFNGRPVRNAMVSESIPNLYGTAWFGMAGETGVTLGPIGIEKETLNPTHTPKISFYKNYNGKAKSSDYSYPVSVETYKGDGTVLVRMYGKSNQALMKCSDVVFYTNGEQLTKASAIIYQEQNELMAKAFNMTLVKG